MNCYWPVALFLTVPIQAAPIQHNYDLKNVLWNLAVDPVRHHLDGDATNTVGLLEDAATVQFHARNLQIKQVWVDGATASYLSVADLLTINLPQGEKKGQVLKIRITYQADPQNGFYFVDPAHAFPSKTGMVYTQGEGEDNRNWLPTYDLPDDKATTECFVTVPKSWTAVSNGKLEGSEVRGETKVFHWKMPQPFSTYLISLVAGPYVEGKSQWHGVPVSYFVPPGLESQGKASFSSTPKMIDLYSKLTGVDYPYPKFSQEVVGDFVVGGMENITAVTQMIRTLHAAGTEPLNDSTGLVAHELAHQWFGDLITCRTWEHMWLNEGFASTLPIFLDRDWHGQDWFEMDRYNNFEGAIDSIGSRGRKALEAETGSVKEVTMGSPYPGGASRILMLMHRLGEAKFWAGIHVFLEKYKFQPVTTSEFFAVMSATSGQNLKDFETQWYHTPATPSLTVGAEGDSIVITQLAPYYKLNLPIWFLKGNTWIKKLIPIAGPKSTLRVPKSSKLPFLLDPECWTLMELSYLGNSSAGNISALYHAAPNVAAKARIVAELFPRISVAERIRLARQEKNSLLVSMIAGKLGSDGQDYLTGLTHHQDIRVASAAVDALGAFALNPASLNRLEELAEGHPNEALREHALRSILKNTTDPKFADRGYRETAFDDGFRTLALDWWVRNAPDKARSISLGILNGTQNEPLRIAACQALGIVKEGPTGDAVLTALSHVATENSFRSRVAAIRSLGTLGNQAAIPVLESISTYAPGAVTGSAAASLKLLKGN